MANRHAGVGRPVGLGIVPSRLAAARTLYEIGPHTRAMAKRISQVLICTSFRKIAGVLAHFSSERPEVKPEAFCALGVLYHSTGRIGSRARWDELDARGEFEILKEHYGITREQYRKLYGCPACGKSEFGLNEFLIHLNDFHDPKTRLSGVVPFTFKEIGQILEREGL